MKKNTGKVSEFCQRKNKAPWLNVVHDGKADCLPC